MAKDIRPWNPCQGSIKEGHWMWFHSIDSAMVGSLKNLGDAPEKGTWLTRTHFYKC